MKRPTYARLVCGALYELVRYEVILALRGGSPKGLVGSQSIAAKVIQPGAGTGHLRRRPPGDLSLLETRALPATLGVCRSIAQKAWHSWPPGDRLSASAVLRACLGGG